MIEQETDNLIKCPNFSAVNVEKARFCAECGKILPINESQLVKASGCLFVGIKIRKILNFVLNVEMTYPKRK
ncbi:MAG: hypothetical protein Q7U35_04670 [Methanobacteriaceae archaeon]|nr:hypothetical protein [Methanobacteriaceae archaeon]